MRQRAISFISDAQQLVRVGRVEAALDLIYDRIDEMMRQDNLAELDGILPELSVAELSDHILLGVLTATLPIRTRLPSRPGLFGRIEQVLQERGAYEEGLLTGLE